MLNRLLFLSVLLMAGGCAQSSPTSVAQVPAPTIALNKHPSGLNTVPKVKEAIAHKARLLGGNKPSQRALCLATFYVLERAGTFKEALAIRDVLVEREKTLGKLSATASTPSEKSRLDDLLYICNMEEFALMYRAAYLRNGFAPSGNYDYVGDKQRALKTAQKLDTTKK